MTGSVAWFARNRVAANLIMALVILGGLVAVGGFAAPLKLLGAEDRLPFLARGVLRQEVFPEFSLDLITVSVPYRGAAPEEVEEGVNVRIEEEIADLDGVRRITSVATEGLGLVTAELQLGADSRKVLDDIKARVDAIDTFPEETEKPIIREVTNRRQVIDVALYGEADEWSLRRLAERTRDEIAALPGITNAELANVRPYEMAIEVDETALRRYRLSFDQVADAVRRSSLDLPGGQIRTSGGQILLRTKGQAYRREEFERLPLITGPDGTRLTVGDVARVADGFEETDQRTRFNGHPAVLIQVFRTGEQDALAIADTVEGYVVEASVRLPPGIELTTWNDAARILRGRRDLLLRNGAGGLVLVVILLALFLRPKLALWVAVGMAVSFLGAIWLMPALGVSINLISLFAFILVLGIVVDDAIVVGENVYSHQQRHGEGLRGAIEGTQEVSLPVVFAVLTTVAAFLPLLAVAGNTGKIMRTIPLIVIPCLLWSLAESLWILPAHLAHYRRRERAASGPGRLQFLLSDGLQRFVTRIYGPTLDWALRWRYLTIAIGAATLLLTLGLVRGGFIRFVFFPDVESDFISAAVRLPEGAPVSMTSAVVERLERSAEQLRGEVRERTGQDPFRHLLAAVGQQPFRQAQRQNAGSAGGADASSSLGELTIELLPAEQRSVGSAELAARWRELAGAVPDALEVNFTASIFSPGEDINVQLTGSSIDELQRAADALQQRLGEYAGVYEIADSFLPGKREVKLRIRPQAEALGLTLADLGRQVRQAFYGEEAQRIQRGRDDVRVMVRYPDSQRRSLGDLESLRIRTADGHEVPFSEVAEVRPGRGYAAITRVDRRRAINVTADVDPAQANAAEIVADLSARVLPGLLADHPGVRYTFEGQQAEQRDTLAGLLRGFVLALAGIFALLAIPLRSYAQPLLIMSAIPFGLVGAVWGHVIMRLDLTILSMFGLVALTGVVVNDSLVMVDFINRRRGTRGELLAAVRQAGLQRFRAILLTSLTTFAGLLPLMLERSMQARFLIPMAVSLAFGVMFSTFVTLVLVPAGYMALDDLGQLPARLRAVSSRTRARTAGASDTRSAG